jgi:hypothetical protein
LLRIKNNPNVQEKPFDWIRAYQVGGNHFYGQDKLNVGLSMILKAQIVINSLLNGQLVMMIQPLGIAMLKNLLEFLAIKTV